MASARVFAVALGFAAASTLPAQSSAARAAPPSLLIGQFADDYGDHFTLSDSTFLQGSQVYHITKWNVTREYFIAWFVPDKSSAMRLWARVDWVVLPNMAPYEWGMCLSAYQAPTADSAEATHLVNRETPKTGCNKYPFSRMKRDGR